MWRMYAVARGARPPNRACRIVAHAWRTGHHLLVSTRVGNRDHRARDDRQSRLRGPPPSIRPAQPYPKRRRPAAQADLIEQSLTSDWSKVEKKEEPEYAETVASLGKLLGWKMRPFREAIAATDAASCRAPDYKPVGCKLCPVRVPHGVLKN